MYKNSKLNKQKLVRLEKYKSWLEDDRHFNPALYKIVNEAILSKTIPGYFYKKGLNQIETEYQKYKLNPYHKNKIKWVKN